MLVWRVFKKTNYARKRYISKIYIIWWMFIMAFQIFLGNCLNTSLLFQKINSQKNPETLGLNYFSWINKNSSSHWRCSKKYVFSQIPQNLQENICVRVSFFRPTTLLKRKPQRKFFLVHPEWRTFWMMIPTFQRRI